MRDLKTGYEQIQILAPQALSGAFQTLSAPIADYTRINLACSLADQDGGLAVEGYNPSTSSWVVITDQNNIVGQTIDTAGEFAAVSGSMNDVSVVSTDETVSAVRLSGYVDASTEVACSLFAEVKRG